MGRVRRRHLAHRHPSSSYPPCWILADRRPCLVTPRCRPRAQPQAFQKLWRRKGCMCPANYWRVTGCETTRVARVSNILQLSCGVEHGQDGPRNVSESKTEGAFATHIQSKGYSTPLKYRGPTAAFFFSLPEKKRWPITCVSSLQILTSEVTNIFVEKKHIA